MSDPSGNWPKWLKKAAKKVKKVVSKVAKKFTKTVKNLIGGCKKTTVTSSLSMATSKGNMKFGVSTTTSAGSNNKKILLYTNTTFENEKGGETIWGIKNNFTNTDVSIGKGGYSYAKTFVYKNIESSIGFTLTVEGELEIEVSSSISGENEETAYLFSYNKDFIKPLILALESMKDAIIFPAGIPIPVLMPAVI